MLLRDPPQMKPWVNYCNTQTSISKTPSIGSNIHSVASTWVTMNKLLTNSMQTSQTLSRVSWWKVTLIGLATLTSKTNFYLWRKFKKKWWTSRFFSPILSTIRPFWSLRSRVWRFRLTTSYSGMPKTPKNRHVNTDSFSKWTWMTVPWFIY